MSTLLATEHERGLHATFHPPGCVGCAENPNPAPVLRSKSPQTEVETPAPVKPGNLAAAFEKLRRSWTIVETDDPPGPSTPDGEPECDVCRSFRWLRHDVPRSDPNFGKLVPCNACGVITKLRLQRLWGDLPEHFQAMRLDTYPTATPAQRQLVERLKKWLDGDRWLYLYGKPGRGKSGLAVSLLHQLVQGGQSGVFKVVPDLLDRIRRTYRSREAFDEDEQDMLESLYDVDVLILDDLGAEKSSDWASEKLFQVIGHRHDSHKRTIVTSNLDLRELAGHLQHPRVPSRIGEMADVIDLSPLPNLRVA